MNVVVECEDKKLLGAEIAGHVLTLTQRGHETSKPHKENATLGDKSPHSPLCMGTFHSNNLFQSGSFLTQNKDWCACLNALIISYS